MSQEYVPGKCNIGARGRAMRLSTGLIVIGFFLLLGLTLFSSGSLRLARLGLVVPFYVGFLSVLEGGMSFCVFHAARGTYDLHERLGPMGKSEKRHVVESEEWKRIDRQKAWRMHLEALAGALLMTGILFLA